MAVRKAAPEAARLLTAWMGEQRSIADVLEILATILGFIAREQTIDVGAAQEAAAEGLLEVLDEPLRRGGNLGDQLALLGCACWFLMERLHRNG